MSAYLYNLVRHTPVHRYLLSCIIYQHVRRPSEVHEIPIEHFLRHVCGRRPDVRRLSTLDREALYSARHKCGDLTVAWEQLQGLLLGRVGQGCARVSLKNVDLS
jgi:hypothetical protein